MGAICTKTLGREAQNVTILGRDIERSLSVVYDAFIDDSKDRHAEKVVVSGIFIGDKNKWGFLRTKWNERLACVFR